MRDLSWFDILKTIGQGALGAMTFGMYYQYTSTKMIEAHNKKMAIQFSFDRFK